ncbi:MAG TPA: RsmD family RNA methyltransferase [Chloroflexota bacterium]
MIAGTARGRPLRAAADIRPTADLIKGSIFSMLEALAYKRGFEPDEEGALAAALAWPRVLDLFAGSGALGIEALSRGVQHATFVEHDRASTRIIDANLRATGLTDHALVQIGPVHLVLPRLRGPFDLVFADPPYGDNGALQHTVALLTRGGLLTPDSVVVLEQPSAEEPPAEIGPLPCASTRRHGRTRVSLFAGW